VTLSPAGKRSRAEPWYSPGVPGRWTWPAAVALLVLSGCYQSRRLLPGGEGEEPPPVVVDAGAPPVVTPPGMPPPVAPPVVPRPPPPESPDDVRDVCETGERETVDVPLALPGNVLRRCPWGVDDNLPPAQERATARIEDRTDPVLADDDAVLCGLELDFEVDDAFRYDDNFFLLFGDSVLAASDRALVERLPRTGRIRRWDWDRVAGNEMLVFGSRPYCLGAEDGSSECVLPDSDLADRLALRFDQELVEELSFRAFEAGRADFTVVAVGDNDFSTDCQYSPLSVQATVTFVRTE